MAPVSIFYFSQNVLTLTSDYKIYAEKIVHFQYKTCLISLCISTSLNFEKFNTFKNSNQVHNAFLQKRVCESHAI